MERRIWLQCTRCAHQFDCGPLVHGCPDCARAGHLAALEVAYDHRALAETAKAVFSSAKTFWDYAPLFPVPPDARRLSLGEGNTPLIRSVHVGPGLGLPNLFFKNETVNPTWSFKDRYNAVTVAVASSLGFRRIVNSSTGNHGASVAAYSAVAGMDCIILCPPQVSETLRLQVGTYGAQVVSTAWDGRARLMEYLAQERGWFPAGLFMPFAISNPYGVEGYKTFAYELWRQLPEIPDHIFFPCARGNGLYGCWKGWRELQAFGFVDAIPHHHATQPEGAAPLVQSVAQNVKRSVVVSDPHSVATSIREAVGSDQALEAIYASGGTAVSVADREILEAVHALGREGLCVEPASAAPVAAVKQLTQSGKIHATATIVCVLTAAGIKWPADMAAAAPRPPVSVEPDPRDLGRYLEAWGWL